MAYRATRNGTKVSPSTISRLAQEAIAEACRACGVHPPSGIVAHSLRGTATTAAFRAFPSLVMQSFPHTFVKHYKIDTFAAGDTVFARRVL